MKIIPFSDPLLWDEKISEHEEATIFHSSAWAKVIDETYGHRSELYEISKECLLPITEINSKVTGKRGHCVPFADRCSILGNAENIPDEVIDVAQDRRWEKLEIRGENEIPEKVPASASYVRHLIHLGSETEKHFSQSAKRGVKKAERSGLIAKVVSPSDSLGVERYYKLHTQTRRRHGLPPQPVRFFRAIQRHIISEKLGFVVEIEERGSSRVIASAVFFQFGKTAFYKFGASDATAWSLRPNNLLFAHAIRHLCECALFSELDLGRSDLPDTELHRFKRGWGAKEFPLSYFSYRLVDKKWISGTSPDSAKDKIHNRIFRSLPQSMNRLAGSLLYPHRS